MNILYFSHPIFPFMSLYKYFPTSVMCILFIQVIIFQYANSSFVCGESLLRNCILYIFGFWAAQQYMLDVPISHAKGHVPFSNPLVIPLSFQAPAVIETNHSLLFLEQNLLYSSLPNLCFIY